MPHVGVRLLVIDVRVTPKGSMKLRSVAINETTTKRFGVTVIQASVRLS
jgi:hypothetical protein